MLIEMKHGGQRNRIDPTRAASGSPLQTAMENGGEEASSGDERLGDDERLGSWEKAAQSGRGHALKILLEREPL